MDSNSRKRKVLLTGARSYLALELARNFHGDGHEVLGADTSSFHVTRFSNAVSKFIVIPSPRFSKEAFLEKLLKIVEEEHIDLLIPMWEEAVYLSEHLDRFPKSCKVFCSSFDVMHMLHNKWLFMEKLKSFNMTVPRSYLLKSEKDLDTIPFTTPYVVKACYCRAADHIKKTIPPKLPSIKIDAKNPWIAQEYLEGKRFCSYSVCYQGKLLGHTAYPVQYTLDGNSCIAFEAIKHPEIQKWVNTFIEKMNYTGQIGFDFIETEAETNNLYAIDCNPRATCGIHLFNSKDQIIQAFLNETTTTISPEIGSTQQIAVAMLIYGLKEAVKEKAFSAYVKKLFTTKDVIFSSNDLRPFLSQPIILISYLIRSFREGLSLPDLFTYDLDWNEMPK